MTVSFVGITAPATTVTDTLVVNKPAGGVVAGDLMLMYVHLVNQVAPRYPDGWLEVPWAYFSESQWGFTVLGKIAGDSEPDDYTLVYPASGANAAGIVAFRSDTVYHMRVPIAATEFTETPSGSDPYVRAWPQVTVEVAAMLALFGTYSWASTAGAGGTERWDGAGSGIQRPYLMTAAGGPGLTPAITAESSLSSSFRNATVPIVEDDPDPYPGPQFISAVSVEGEVDGGQAVTLPTDIEAGDYLVAQITTTTEKTYTFPAGWEEVADVTVTGAEGMYVYAKTAAAEDAGATLTVTFAAGTVRAALGVTTYRSLRGREIVIEVADVQTNSSSTTITFPELTTAYTNAMYLYAAAFALNTNIGTPGGSPIRYARGSSTVSYQIRAYTQHTFAAGAYAFAPTVGSGTASHAATIVIVELEPANDSYMVGDGHDVAIDDLIPLAPQPRNAGIRITRRDASHSGDAHQDDALYLVLEWSAVGSVDEYQSILSQLGLLNAKENDITATARDQNQVWQRWNGRVMRPRVNEDMRHELYFPRNINIYMVDMELAG